MECFPENLLFEIITEEDFQLDSWKSQLCTHSYITDRSQMTKGFSAMIKAIAFSAYPVSDMTRARQFYEHTLGLTPAQTFGDHWQEYDLGDSTFAIVVQSDQAPECYRNSRGTTIAFEVENLEPFIQALQAKNVPVVYGPAEFPACKMAVITDPDQNVIAIHQLNKAEAS